VKALIEEQIRRKAECKAKIPILESYLKRVHKNYLNKEIPYSKYLEILHKKINGKTVHEWIEYYDSCVIFCDKEIRTQKRKLIQKNVIIFFSIFFFISIASVIFYTNPLFIGFLIQEDSQSYSETLNLQFTESKDYEWVIQNIGQLTSLKLSGSIEGQGNVKVYLDDLLVLDNSNIQSNAGITGKVSEEIPSEEPVTEPDSSSENINEDASQEDSSPSQEASSSETSEQDPVSETIIDPTPDSSSENINEDASQEDSSPSQEASSSEIEEELQIEEETPEEEINESEVIEKNVTEIPEKESEDETTEKPKETSKTTRIFTNLCEETCDLSSLNLKKSSYVLRIEISNPNTILNIDEIVYDLTTLEEIPDEAPTENETKVPEINITIPEENITETPLENLIEFNATVQTTQFQAILGQPVKWKKNIQLYGQGIVKIKIPKDAKNITVVKVKDNLLEEQFIQENSSSENINGDASQEDSSPSQEASSSEIKEKSEENTPALDKVEKQVEELEETLSNLEERLIQLEKNLEKTNESESDKVKFTITAQVISESNEGFFLFEFFKNIFSTITGQAVDIAEQGEELEITIEDNATAYVIEYETPAPYAIEEPLIRGKRVKIIGTETTHYTNVLAFTNLSENLNVKNPNSVKIHWVENNTFLPTQEVLDLDGNGIYDYISWIAPILSNQTFDIIVITKAEHLDSNREFISDIYEEAKELDGNWTETIPANNYVRVTFEIPLDNTKDITVYPRTTSGNPRIEVYEYNQSELIAEFTNITDNEYNKIFLTNLNGTQDTFDLKILDGSVEFDHIIDPVIYVNFTASPSSANRNGTTFSHTMPAGNDRVIVVLVLIEGNENVGSITFNGNNLTEVVDSGDTGSAGDVRAKIYVGAEGSSGSPTTANVIVNSSSGNWNPSIVYAVNVNNSNQFTIIGAGNGTPETGTGASLASTTLNIQKIDSIVIAAAAGQGANYFPWDPNVVNSNQVERDDAQTGSSNSQDFGYWLGTLITTGTGNQNFGADGSTLDENVVGAIEILEAGPISVTSCQNLSITGESYILQNNILATPATCFNITADDITLDGNGFTLDFGTGGIEERYGVDTVGGRNNITIKNFGNITDYTTGINFDNLNNSLVINNTVADNSDAIEISGNSNNNTIINNNLGGSNGFGVHISENSNNNRIINNNISANVIGIRLISASNNIIENNTIDLSTDDGIHFFSGTNNNQLINNRITNSINLAILETSSFDYNNSLIYNNSFGDIRWNNNGSGSFVGDLRITGDIGLGINPIIGNNTVFLNASAFTSSLINSSANITLYGMDSFSFTVPKIFKDGIECTSSECHNFTALNIATIKFNVTYAGYNYTIGEGADLTACSTLDQAGVTYTLQNDITGIVGNCFNITADDIVLDGNRFTIDGDDTDPDSGVYATGRDNLTIKNFFNITDFDRGIRFSNTNNSLITNNTANSNQLVGIQLDGNSNNNTIINNTANSNLNWGIEFTGTHTNNNQIINNTANSNSVGIRGVSGSNNNQIINNTANSNSGKGLQFFSSSNNTIINNTVNSNGKGISLDSNSNNNQLLNNLIIDSATLDIEDDTGNSLNNSLIYNNSFGDIRWNNNGTGTFLGNLTIIGNIGLGINLTIGNNTVNLNASAFTLSLINSSANITLYGVDTSGFSTPIILRNGVNCGNDCVNFTHLDVATIKFNVTYAGANYSIGDDADTIAPEITIDSPTNTTSSATIDFNITLNEALHTAYYSLDGSSNNTLDNDSNTHYFNLSTNHSLQKQHYLHLY